MVELEIIHFGSIGSTCVWGTVFGVRKFEVVNYLLIELQFAITVGIQIFKYNNKPLYNYNLLFSKRLFTLVILMKIIINLSFNLNIMTYTYNLFYFYYLFFALSIIFVHLFSIYL